MPPSPGRLRQGDENKVMDFDHCNYIFKIAAVSRSKQYKYCFLFANKILFI